MNTATAMTDENPTIDLLANAQATGARVAALRAQIEETSNAIIGFQKKIASTAGPSVAALRDELEARLADAALNGGNTAGVAELEREIAEAEAQAEAAKVAAMRYAGTVSGLVRRREELDAELLEAMRDNAEALDPYIRYLAEEEGERYIAHALALVESLETLAGLSTALVRAWGRAPHRLICEGIMSVDLPAPAGVKSIRAHCFTGTPDTIVPPGVFRSRLDRARREVPADLAAAHGLVF